MWFNEHVALKANYGFEETSYLQKLLPGIVEQNFWGDEVILYAVSCMWNLQITVFNSHMDEEYCIRHNAIMDQADVNIVLNGGTHYSAGGKWCLSVVSGHLYSISII